MPQGTGSFWEIAYVLVVMAGVIALAYFASKWLSRRYATQGRTKDKYFEIVDRLMLGQNQSVVMVKSGKKYLMLGVTQHNVQMLKEFEEDELEPITSEAASISFSDNLKQALRTNLGLKNKDGSSMEEDKSDDER